VDLVSEATLGNDVRRGLGRVLVAEDDREVRDALAEMLDANGYEVVGRAETGRRAIELTTSTEPDVVLLDYRMPSGDGITVTQAIRKETPATQVIMLTAFDEASLSLEARTCGAFAFLAKGCPQQRLLATLEEAVKSKQRTEAEGSEQTVDLWDFDREAQEG